MWYRFAIIRTANEYWFHDREQNWADTDQNGISHEDLAEQAIINYFIKHFPDTFERHEVVNSYVLNEEASRDYDFIEFLKNKYNYTQEEAIDKAYGGNYVNWLITGDDEERTPEVQKYLEAMRDPRKFVIDNWGWIRVQGNYIQTYNLDQTHLDEIVNGLREIFGSHDEEFDKHIQNKKFNLDVDGLILKDVPFWEIKDGSVVKRLKQGVDDILDVKRRQLPTPGGYQYKDVGAKKRNYKYCHNLHDLENIAQEVANMHPYDPAKHFDLISKLSQSTSYDPLEALKERASPYRDYN